LETPPGRGLAFLRSLTTRTGLVRYSRLSSQTPVWVTGQAVMALARKPLPLAPVPRPHRAVAAAATPAPAPAATSIATAAPAPARVARPTRRPKPAPSARAPSTRPRATSRGYLVLWGSPADVARAAGLAAGAAAAILLPAGGPAV
jgi:hypothetical protein